MAYSNQDFDQLEKVLTKVFLNVLGKKLPKSSSMDSPSLSSQELKGANNLMKALKNLSLAELQKLDTSGFSDQLKTLVDSEIRAKRTAAQLEYLNKEQQRVEEGLLRERKEGNISQETFLASLSKKTDEINKRRERVKLNELEDEERHLKEFEKATQNYNKTRDKLWKERVKGELTQNEYNKKNVKELKELNKQYANTRATEGENPDYVSKQQEWLDKFVGTKLDIQRDADENLSHGLQGRNIYTVSGKDFLQEGINKIHDGIKDIASKLDSEITALADLFTKTNARMQGLDESFNDIVRNVGGLFLTSMTLSGKNIVEHIKQLSEKGVGFNLEYRGFIAGLAEKVATTFTASNDNLLRLIRLQLTESTDTRLAMESKLTRVLNQLYKDSSYLSDSFDRVEGILLEANSLLSNDASLQFEYAVQQWLGALSSLGVSSTFVDSIATGINYLGTGNVQALAGNTPLQTLMAMGVSRAGMSYGEILTRGINPDETLKLLHSITEYLAEIYDQNESLVVKSAYGQVFGFTLSDLKAINNFVISETENSLLKKTEFNSDIAHKELMAQSLLLNTRMSVAEMMNTFTQNMEYGMATSIASTAPLYMMYKISLYVKDFAGGLPIPFISTAGFGLDIHTSVGELIDLANIATGLMSSMAFGGPNMPLAALVTPEAWMHGARTTGIETRGKALTLGDIAQKYNRNTSESANFGSTTNFNPETMKQAESSKALSEANENKEAYASKDDLDTGETARAIYKAANSQGDDIVAVVPFNPDYSIHLGTLYEALFSHENYVMVDLWQEGEFYKQFTDYTQSSRDVSITSVEASVIWQLANSISF